MKTRCLRQLKAAHPLEPAGKARAKSESLLREAQAENEARRLKDQADADALRAKAEMELELHERRQKIGEIFANQPALMRLQELEALRELARNGNARIYIGFDKHWPSDGIQPEGPR